MTTATQNECKIRAVTLEQPVPQQLQLARRCLELTPLWAHMSPSDIEVRVLTGGLSNKLYTCSVKQDGTHPKIVVLREFCRSQNLVDRDFEAAVFEYLAEVGLGPKVYGYNAEFRSEQYLEGVSLNVREYAETQQLAIVAELLARMHVLDPPGFLAKRPSSLFDVIDRSVTLAMASLAPAEDLRHLEGLKKKFDQIVRPALLALQSPVVFCHNDAQEGNVLRMSQGPQPFLLIDYEYMSWNYRGFDLANVLCEAMIDNGASTPTGFEILPHLQPSEAALRTISTAYLKAIDPSRHVTPMQVDTLVREMQQFQAASHLMWGSWSLAKCGTNEIDFGYYEYGVSRLELFEQSLALFQ